MSQVFIFQFGIHSSKSTHTQHWTFSSHWSGSGTRFVFWSLPNNEKFINFSIFLHSVYLLYLFRSRFFPRSIRLFAHSVVPYFFLVPWTYIRLSKNQRISCAKIMFGICNEPTYKFSSGWSWISAEITSRG